MISLYSILKQVLVGMCAVALISCVVQQSPSPENGAAQTKYVSMPQGKDLVLEVQQILISKSYDPGPVDGVMGNKTSSALKDFQSDQNLSVTGEIDESTYASLKRTEDSSSGVDDSTQETDEPSLLGMLGTQLMGAMLNEAGLKLPESGAAAGSKEEKSMTGLEPVGQISKPGCEGVEVIGYAERAFIANDKHYYVAIRNNNTVTKMVDINYIGGRRADGGKPLSGHVTLKIAAGEIENWNVDYAISAPKLLEVTRCL